MSLNSPVASTSSRMKEGLTTYPTNRQVIIAATGIMMELLRKSNRSRNAMPANSNPLRGP